MASAVQKITLAASRDIPFNKLVLSQSNVRRVKAGVSVEELAEDIARRGLLQGLTVRTVVDADGVETGMYEVPAGGRRYRALELLVKRKRLAKTAPVPCIVKAADDPVPAEEDSLAENIQRAQLHPLDQFRAFLSLREKGQSEEEIAATFFVSVQVVKQRLKLASVSPKLLDVYAEDGMTLDQLMAFTVSGDHQRQEQVFERLQSSYDKQPYVIRRWLTEGAVRAADKRAQFIGVDAYVEAGGSIMRDLFQGDDGGWLQDVALVDLMVAEKLGDEAATVQAEGWKWIEVAPDFAYGHTFGLRQLRGEPIAITADEQAARDALQAEYDSLVAEFEDADEVPDGVDERLGELETAIEAIDARPLAYDPAEIARAGAFISIDHSGDLRVERGYVRPEDELPIEPVPEAAAGDGSAVVQAASEGTDDSVTAETSDDAGLEPEEDEGLSPISDRLLTELTAHRTLALRHTLGERPDIAFVAALHALTLKAFYSYAPDSCLELDLKSVSFGQQAPGLNDSASARAVRERHQTWANALPTAPEELWDTLMGWDDDSRQGLFAHVVAQSVNAVYEVWNRRPRALAHTDKLAQSVELDMATAGWTPTVDNFFGRVTKARILAAVAEAKGQRAADRIGHLKKGDMASQAQELLAGSGWLPEPLRTPGRTSVLGEAPAADLPAVPATDGASDPTIAETTVTGGETAMAQDEPLGEYEEVNAASPHAVAAE
ncbi:MAG TPA: ParB/RepB/Spo0J family partition protein [Mesorhizobium sp.]|jgi:ParB family chromosome partitioning protein|nr:ParB/RepB/Spo0J family partition protein [Mesorhizobium sp.]